MNKTFLTIVLLAQLVFVRVAKAEDPAVKILGKWISDEKNLIVEVYKLGNKYNAKILWFRPVDAKTKVVYKTHDVHNPDVKLRTRKIVGIDVVQNLVYNENTHQWVDGLIYDATLGRQWSAFAYLSPKEALIVKGYWHFKFLSKTLVFTKFDKSLPEQ